jgi:hypothetical protein
MMDGMKAGYVSKRNASMIPPIFKLGKSRKQLSPRHTKVWRSATVTLNSLDCSSPPVVYLANMFQLPFTPCSIPQQRDAGIGERMNVKPQLLRGLKMIPCYPRSPLLHSKRERGSGAG